MSARVTVISVTYKAREIIADAIEALQPACLDGSVRLVLVDNDSNDGTPEFVRETYPWVEMLESGGNLGFGRGCNVGLAAADSEYVLFLNPDAALDPPDLQHLVDYLDQHPKVGMVAPAIRDPDGGLQVTDALPTPWGLLRHAMGRGTAFPIEPGVAPFRTGWICGAAILARRSLLNDLGGFDPRFFLYFEETDLCRRVMAAGYEIWAVPQAVARHRDGEIARATRLDLYHGCIARHYFESRYYYLVKHHGWLPAATTELLEAVLMSVRAFGRALRGRSNANYRVRMRSPFFRQPPEVSA